MTRPSRPSRPAARTPDREAPHPVWPGVVGFLLTARYLQPTEGAVFGETLWQAQLWLVAAGVWCWLAWKAGRLELRWSLLDGCLWLLAAAHAISTAPVFFERGDRRAAVNLVWEWAGLAATAFLVRQTLTGSDLRRPLFGFAAVMTALGAVGVWQHHVAFPQTAARYAELRAEESDLAERGSAAARDRLGEVRRELAGFGAPDDPAARRRWEDRLRFSSEPLGTFALANTLGGLLAVAIPLAISVGLARPVRPYAAGVAGMLGVLLYALMLTKSRTAWVGLAAGGFAAGGMLLVRGKLTRRTVAVAAAGAAAVPLVGLAALASGGLDRAVFWEASKSLRFRLDYWAGALRVLAERPLLGTGPGNFRSAYLRHRSEGASEAIASPHNLLLDAWTAGGLLALVALSALLGYALYRLLTAQYSEEPPPLARAPAWGGWEWGFAAAFPALVPVAVLAGESVEWLLMTAPVAVAALLVLKRSNAPRDFAVACGAGLCALVVHLLGADGIEFPAVFQTLICLALAGDSPRAVAVSRPRLLSVAGGFAVLVVGCLMTGTVPVLNSAALTARGTSLAEAGDPAADAVLAEAAAADPLSIGPLQLRAEWAAARAIGSGSEADLASAVRRWREVLAARPDDIHSRRRLAGLLLGRDPAAAADLLAEAVRLSPTESALWADLARAAGAAGRADEAARAAAEALRLDGVNRAAGHLDLYFTDEARDALARLTVAGNARRGP